MKDEIQNFIQSTLGEMGVTDVTVLVTRPADSKHGDYTTNVAMQLAKTLKKSPVSIATELKEKIDAKIAANKATGHDQKISNTSQNDAANSAEIDVLQAIAEIAVIPPGFLNIKIRDGVFINQLSTVLKTDKPVVARNPRKPGTPIPDGAGPAGHFSRPTSSVASLPAGARREPLDARHPQTLSYGWNLDHAGHRLMVEFAHPNTHKAFHIGHLRNITTGESIVRLLGAIGYDVIRTNYQGDVGMHIAKCLYGILNNSQFRVYNSQTKTVQEKVELLGKAYAAGSQAFEGSDEVKKKVGEINKKIYAKDPEVYSLYQETRQWSLDYFDSLYKRLGTHFDRLYFESQTYETGKEYTLEGVKKGIFVESDGAIIFPGDTQGLHNRVFITREGNPTYEAKDMGLGRLQMDEYHPEMTIHVLGPEQFGYTRVMFEALAQLFPDTRDKQYHLVYGWVKLKHGKMSSRTGNVVLGEWLLDTVKEEITSHFAPRDALGATRDVGEFPKVIDENEVAEKLAVAAVKYSFLKVSTSSDIAFDLEESVNIHGDSGPYLMYTYARCRSVMRKALTIQNDRTKNSDDGRLAIGDWKELNTEEREVARLVSYFPEVVAEAAENHAPSAICSYLFELAQAYNLFYTKHTILGQESKKVREEESKMVREGSDQIKMVRLALTEATGTVLQNGLFLLGIETVERM